MIIYFFFFSSRRRHTRCYRDWSSDVCSSDLGARELPRAAEPLRCRGDDDSRSVGGRSEPQPSRSAPGAVAVRDAPRAGGAGGDSGPATLYDELGRSVNVTKAVRATFLMATVATVACKKGGNSGAGGGGFAGLPVEVAV